LEFPENWGGIIDWDGRPECVPSIVLECLHSTDEDQVAFRNASRYVPRLVKTEDSPLTEIPISSEATYLITGGLGFLGMRFAQALIDKGARHILLQSRRNAPPDHMRELLSPLKLNGARVDVIQGDVSNTDDVNALRLSLQNADHPLKGVIHAAGVVDFRPSETVNEETWNAVIRPKVLGTWNLHCMTRDLPLDFFIMFSSIASVWGSRGQAAYAAANHFLDSFSYFRRQQQLPATSINWGPW